VIWVIVNKEPLARSVCNWADSWKDALKHHVEQIRQWMKAKRPATSVEKQHPFGLDLTEEVETQIEARLAHFEGFSLVMNGQHKTSPENWTLTQAPKGL